MKILLTGAAGFIGFHTSKILLERGDEVVGLDNLNDFNKASYSANQPPENNSTDEELLTALLLRHQLNQPEMCYDVDESVWDPTVANQSTNKCDHHAEDDGADRGRSADGTELPEEPPF